MPDDHGLLEAALQYAARGWRVFPCHTTISGTCSCGKDCGRDAGKHPACRTGVRAATTAPDQIRTWWRRNPNFNIGLASGSGLVIVDLDGQTEIDALAAAGREHGGLPKTLVAQTGRGFHAYFKGDLSGSRTVEIKGARILFRGQGGYCIAPPSLHASGKRYQWVYDVPLAEFPNWLNNIINSSLTPNEITALGPLPDFLRNNRRPLLNRALQVLAPPWNLLEQQKIESALKLIPASCARDPWLRVGMALKNLQWHRPDGTDWGFETWRDWSSTCPEKFSDHDVETRWRSFKKAGVNIGTLYHIARGYGWDDTREAPSSEITQTNLEGPPASPPGALPFLNGHKVNGHTIELASDPGSPLIELNRDFAVIGQVGGKCVVMEMVDSDLAGVKVPVFQSFTDFRNRHLNRYIARKKIARNGEAESDYVSLGAEWLKWPHRTTYRGLDIAPGGPTQLPNGHLNLWRGFGVEPRPGDWSLMKQHIAEILANGNRIATEYIVRWAAWAVQNPGERAEAALVFRGGKGTGKGSFATALTSVFGPHGLHIHSSKHLVGSFNGHLRNCLLLFADEAFWAGDKQGESTLKGMLTDPTIIIEQKKIDAIPWRNRLHVIMAANADWVVPASHDERRYAVFEVAETRARDRSYFDALHNQLRTGGLAAMLHDLLHLELKGWHPREIPETKELQKQKEETLRPVGQFWTDWVEESRVQKMVTYKGPEQYVISLEVLLEHARQWTGQRISRKELTKFLREQGCHPVSDGSGRYWALPPLKEARAIWEQKYGKWNWSNNKEHWDIY